MELFTSRQPNGLIPFPVRRAKDDLLDAEKFKINFLMHLRALVLKAKSHTERTAEMYKLYHDRAVKLPPSVRKGDRVYVQRPPSCTLTPEKREKSARCSKLQPKSISPFRVTFIRADVVTIN